MTEQYNNDWRKIADQTKQYQKEFNRDTDIDKQKGGKLEKFLNYEISGIPIKDYLDLTGYLTSTIALTGLSLLAIESAFTDQLIQIDMYSLNEHYIEIPLFVYSALWNANKAIKGIRAGTFNK